ncbi:MAG TPA: alpha/beta fold hydrolase [Thermoleophilaceae bacterium]|jgi:alpha-beta hydrolase superfamily lysophospholipase|nr:alpha/beta fold hydrolase [Thermoleophilaceae bacterium]
MRTPLPTPEPPQLGERNGLAYALFLPDEAPSAGIVICHGAGSAKESHFDFGRAARGAGMAAVAFDARGHGRSQGEFGPTAFADVLEMVDLMREHTPKVALRGSSMGGFQALHAAAIAEPPLAAVVAICPAPEESLLIGLRRGGMFSEKEIRMDAAQVEPWLETLDIRKAVASLAGRTAVMFMHAQGDESVPYTVSEELYVVAGEPKRLLIVPGGHHRSLQHDGEMQAETIRFIQKSLRT